MERLSAFEALVKSHADEIDFLKTELAFYESGPNSSNSHLPPGADLNKTPSRYPKKKKSSNHPGGQDGHKANRLEKVDAVDEVIVHEVASCCHCGEDIWDQEEKMIRTAQVFLHMIRSTWQQDVLIWLR